VQKTADYTRGSAGLPAVTAWASGPARKSARKAAKRRRFDVLVVWKLDRLGRNLRHLILLLDELASLGVGFVSLGEGIDTQTPAGRLQLHILGAIAEFERERLRERVLAGLSRARAQGRKLGRPTKDVPVEKLASVEGFSVREAAARLGVSIATVSRWRAFQKTHGNPAV